MSYLVHCKKCGFSGVASQVKKHTDRKLLLRCPHCCSTNVGLIGINADGGQTFGQTHVEAGARMNITRRGGSKAGAE